MATSYTPIARFPIMTPLDPAVRDQYGFILNRMFALIEQLAAGNANISVDGQIAYTLTVANDEADQARQAMLPFVGALTGDCTITIPSVSRFGLVVNNTTGGKNVILTTGAGSSLTVTPGAAYLYTCDGNNVSAVAVGSTGVLNATPGVVIGNGSTYSAVDTGGVTRRLLGIGTDNFTNLFSGGVAGWRVLNQAGSTALVTVNASGAMTLAGGITANGPATVTGTMHVTSTATFDGNVSVAGTLGVNGTITAPQVNTTGPVTIAGLANLTGGVQLANPGSLSGRAANQVSHPLISLGADNFTNLFNAGGVTWRVLNQLGSLELFSTNEAGQFNIAGTLTVATGMSVTAGSAIFSGGATVAGSGLTVVGSTNQSTSGWQLNASGTGAFTGGVNVAVNASGLDVLANRVIAASDGRIKTKIRTISAAEGMRFVLQCQPRMYLKGGSWEAGFIAQEVRDAGFEEVLFQTEAVLPPKQNGWTGPENMQLGMQENAAQAYVAAAVIHLKDELDRVRMELAELRRK